MKYITLLLLVLVLFAFQAQAACNAGEYDENGTCKKCAYSCATCDSATNCLSCNADNKRTLSTAAGDKSCDCNAGFYDNGVALCDACKSPCANCDKSAYDCTSCISNSDTREGPGLNCQCKTGKFDQYDAAQKIEAACKNCSSKCTNCIDLETCTQCAANRINPPECICDPAGYTQDSSGNCVAKTVTEYDFYGTTDESKNSRCLHKAGNNSNCRICRPDKDIHGKMTVFENVTPSGSWAIRAFVQRSSNYDVSNTHFYCSTNPNDDGGMETGDQEKRTPFCGLYDNYGLCVRCIEGYGLYWSATTEAGAESPDGMWTCIKNEMRTPFCHKYNDSKVCIECKWNQDPEQVHKLFPTGTDQPHELDYALFKSNNKVYCINNRKMDYRIDTLTGDKFKTTDLKNHCAEYNSKYQCVKCHSRQFDLEGNNMWKRTGDHMEIHTDYLIDKFENVGADERPSCQVYPDNYITLPEQLDSFSLTTGSIASTATCRGNLKLKADLATTNYGCVTEVANCDSYQFGWDYDAFQTTGLWHKKLIKCVSCTAAYAVNESTGACIKAENDLENCEKTNESGNSCTKCRTGELYLDGQVNKCAAITAIVDIDNCKTNVYYKTSSGYGKYCKECNWGYVLKQNNDGQYTKCEHWKENRERGCLRLDKDGKCISGDRHGFSSSGKCGGGLMTRMDEVCLSSSSSNQTIPNCDTYVNTDDEGKSRCFKCKDGFSRNTAWNSCLEESDGNSEVVENCTILDGTWCKRCRRGVVEGSETINYILTDQNTCIREPKEWIGRNCRTAKYNNVDALYKYISECTECADGYELNQTSKKCEKETGACNNGEQTIYLYDDWVNGVCGKVVDKCRYYRDTKGNCYECDDVSVSDIYGIGRPNGFAICEKCGAGKILGKNHMGEKVCVDKVDGCEIYSGDKNNYCLICEGSKKLQINTTNNKIECVDTCANNHTEYDEAFTGKPVCVHDDYKDDNCEDDSVTANYEFYSISTSSVPRLRCADCSKDAAALTGTKANNYFLKRQSDDKYKCTAYDDASNGSAFDSVTDAEVRGDKFQRTKAWTINTEDNTYAYDEASLGKYFNSVCNIRIASQTTYPTVFNTKTKMCESTTGTNIDNCMIQDENTDGTTKTCTQCFPGYYITADKKCTFAAALPHLAHTSSVKVSNCYYNLSSGTRNSNCERCDRGYLKWKGTSYDCTEQVHPACYAVSDGGSTTSCTHCQAPFQLYGTTTKSCKLLPEKCIELETNGDCKTCEFGYSLHNKVCLRKTENCQTQDWGKSYDSITKQVRAGVCQDCYGNAANYNFDIKLQYEGTGETKRLGQFCVNGCNRQQRRMSKRTADNTFNLWSCAECRNSEFHLYKDTQKCVFANRIEHCVAYKQVVDGWKEECMKCAIGYYVADSKCASCTKDDNCTKYNQSADKTATKDGTQYCECVQCIANYYISNGICTQNPSDIGNCATYTDGKCSACSQGYYLSENKCTKHTIENCATLSTTSNTCASCNTGAATFNYLTSDGKCKTVDIPNCKTLESDTKCKVCNEGYGLSFNNASCLNNAEKEGGTANCYNYGKSEKVDNEYPPCITCRTTEKYGYAGTETDANVNGWVVDLRNQNDDKYCINLKYCTQGYAVEESGTVNHYCLKCQEKFGNYRVYHNAETKSVCKVENGTAGEIKYCRRYKTAGSFAVCVECHRGFKPDYDGTTYGTACVSEDHPGAMPGCGEYQYLDKSTTVADTDYLKYEQLKCRRCQNKWYFYTYSSTSTSSFSINTFTNNCDRIEPYTSIPLPQAKYYEGKDGGVIQVGTDGGDGGVDPGSGGENDREEYEPPSIVFGAQLAFSLGMLVFVLFTAL